MKLLIGAIHIFSVALLLAYENFSALPATAAYNFYTLIYSFLILVFAVYLWRQKPVGYVGTVLVSLFAIVVDSLAILDLPSVPGAPKGSAYARDSL